MLQQKTPPADGNLSGRIRDNQWNTENEGRAALGQIKKKKG